MFVFAHVSDIHLGQDRDDGGARAARRARRVMDYVNELTGPVEAVLVTGDIADHGLPEEYREAAKILASPHPVLTCPGNHDVRAAYRRGLLGEPDDGRDEGAAAVNRVHHLPHATFVMCDSTIPGRSDGLLDGPTLAWLDGTLAAAPRHLPAFVAFHHPPVALYAPTADTLPPSGERLAEVLKGHEQVAAVLCGHAHTPAATAFAGLPLLVAPGVVSAVRLPCEGGPSLDHGLPPMVALHLVDDDRRITTHFRVVP